MPCQATNAFISVCLNYNNLHKRIKIFCFINIIIRIILLLFFLIIIIFRFLNIPVKEANYI